MSSAKFSTELKKETVLVDEGAAICRGAPAGQHALADYWMALTDKPLMGNTGRHTITFRVLSKGTEGQSGGWAVVGMAAPGSGKRSGPGGSDDSVGVGSDGTSSVGARGPSAALALRRATAARARARQARPPPTSRSGGPSGCGCWRTRPTACRASPRAT